MALPLGDAFLALTVVFGVLLCALGAYCYLEWSAPGVTPLAAVAVVFGVGAVASATIAFTSGPTAADGPVPLWSDVALGAWTGAMVPWVVFALQYTGRKLEFRWRTVAALAVPVAGIYTLLVLRTTNTVSQGVVTQLLGTASLLYLFALVAVGSYLVLRTTYEYGHLSVALGLSLTLAAAGPLWFLNSIGVFAGESGPAVVFGVFAAAFASPVVGFSLAMFRYRLFDAVPATGALGERAIPRETDDLVFVVDRDGRVVTLNETAADTLGVSRTGPLGEPFADLVDATVDDLADAESVALETTAGRRRFDPQATTFTDQQDRCLGWLLSLRDVTERELREQRLEVLNRVLRHNLRNRVDVVKSNAEAVADDTDGEHADAILDAADDLAALGAKARAVDRLVSRPARATDGDLAAVLRAVVADAAADADVAVSVDAPSSAQLVTDWSALRTALEAAVENAVEHAAGAVTVTASATPDGYEVSVADDGDGVPESELASLRAGTETALRHGTGLGLWQLQWGVRKVNGDLSFDTGDGTTVRVTVPDQSG